MTVNEKPASASNAMVRFFTFAVTVVGKSFPPRPLVRNPTPSMEAAVDKIYLLSVKQNADTPFYMGNKPR
jgi:hypothetical protein